MPKQEYFCPTCSKAFYRYASAVSVERPFCSRSCASKSLVGDKNPNYGNRWSDEQKNAFSKACTENFSNRPDLKFAVGSANRGKKFSEERIRSMHSHRSSESYARTVPAERRKSIGAQSKKNWQDPSFRKAVIEKGRKSKEERGLITPRDKMPAWKIYWNAANWKRSFDYGFYEKGQCRDHIVGRRQGFENGIFPEILRHPENCSIISISENSKKARRPANHEEINLLFKRISMYNGNYPDHHLVVHAVEKYLNGERWVKEKDQHE